MLRGLPPEPSLSTKFPVHIARRSLDLILCTLSGRKAMKFYLLSLPLVNRSNNSSQQRWTYFFEGALSGCSEILWLSGLLIPAQALFQLFRQASDFHREVISVDTLSPRGQVIYHWSPGVLKIHTLSALLHSPEHSTCVDTFLFFLSFHCDPYPNSVLG